MKYLLILISAFTLSLISCKENKTLGDQVDESVDNVEYQTNKAAEKVKMRVNDLDDQLDKRIAELDARMEEASEDVKAETNEQISKLKERRNELKASWNDWKANASQDIDEAQNSFNQLVQDIENDLKS